MSDKIRWGIIGAGGIAKAFVQAVPHSKTGRMVGVASRSQEKADSLGNELNIPKCYGSYQALLDDPEIDAVYIATPHPMHAEWAIKAADAGKHILCEKPLAITHADAMTIIEAARRNDVFLMEAFMYRCNPQTKKLCKLIQNKVIGDVRVIRATFSFHTAYDLERRLLNNKLGGGGILDVGCYTTSIARLIAGVAQGKPFAEPLDVKGVGHIGAESRCDEWAVASLRFPGDILAQCATGVQLQQDPDVVIYGSKGKIIMPSPWFCAGREGGTSTIIVHRHGKDPEEIKVNAGWLYAIEADTVAENIDRRQAAWPAMGWEDTLGNMKTLDRWREEVGLVYDLEQPAAYVLPIDKRPLKVRDNNKMKYGQLAGVGKNISRLVMGMDNQLTIAHATAMFDDFFTRGGNSFDTAYVYGGGLQEKLFGQWVRNRNIREETVLIDKGAHTPYCDPESLQRQFLESLERLQMDYMDIYFMHRDNPDIPVGEFIDVLNDLFQKGQIRAFGGSNWTLERIMEANEWAKNNGKQGFAAVSNNFSLARMVAPPWRGCIAASEPEYRQWHEETQMPLFAWSSQARGFFVPDRAHPEKHDEPDLVRCWYSDDNFRRQTHCFELAARKGVHPVVIALAYVLNQPFPVFPLIGPRCISETQSSFEALDIELTPDEVKWLNLEE